MVPPCCRPGAIGSLLAGVLTEGAKCSGDLDSPHNPTEPYVCRCEYADEEDDGDGRVFTELGLGP